MKSYQRIRFAVYLSLFFAICSFGQGRPQGDAQEPVVAPLTEEEKKINPKDIVSNQPNFTAVEAYFSAREISGFSAATKVARQGKKFRTDTGFVVVITEPKKPSVTLHQNNTYEESVGIRRPFVSATLPLNPTDLLEFEDISFSCLGTVTVNGNKLLKIQAKSKEFRQEVFLFADLGQKNLITIVQILSPQRSSIQRLEEISFEIPAELFDISGYRKLPTFTWNKVKSAKVFYNEKLVDDALVFRHNDYVFIHVAEFDHFFVDLKKKVADTVVFQGLLVAKSGSYIWRTDEEVATSIGELDAVITPSCDSCVEIRLEPNSFTIPDPDNKSKTLVKVSW